MGPGSECWFWHLGFLGVLDGALGMLESGYWEWMLVLAVGSLEVLGDGGTGCVGLFTSLSFYNQVI